MDVTPLPKTFKPPKAKKGVRARKAGTAAALKRRATALWGEYIHARDRVCVACGKADGKLDAHHIMVKGFNATRTDETNGVLLCATHHTLGRESVHNDAHWAVCLYTQRLGVNGYAALRAKAFAGVNGRYPASFWAAEVARLTDLLGRVS